MNIFTFNYLHEYLVENPIQTLIIRCHVVFPGWFIKRAWAACGRGWAKYRDLSVASRSIICRSRRLRQIIDLRDTDKSWYFVITEFNNCCIIRSPRLFSYFNHFLTGQGCDLPFLSWKRCSNYAWVEYYDFAAKHV